MEKTVATGGRSSARNFVVVVNNVLESKEHQVAYLFARRLSLDDEIVTCEASHRSPIDDAILPLLIVAKEGSHKMLYGVDSRRCKSRLLIWSSHAYVVGSDVLTGNFVGAGNVDTRLKIGMVNSKTWD